MKYVTSRVVQPKVVKPFEFTSAMTSFSQSLEEMHAAYDAVVAAEGRVLEMEECLNDCHNALESIKAYGVNRTNMGVLNSSGKLDTALGFIAAQIGIGTRKCRIPGQAHVIVEPDAAFALDGRLHAIVARHRAVNGHSACSRASLEQQFH